MDAPDPKDDAVSYLKRNTKASVETARWGQAVLRRLEAGGPLKPPALVLPPAIPATIQQLSTLPGAAVAVALAGRYPPPPRPPSLAADESDTESQHNRDNWEVLCRAVVHNECACNLTRSTTQNPHSGLLTECVDRIVTSMPLDKFEVPLAQFFTSPRLADPIPDSFKDPYVAEATTGQIVRGVWAILHLHQWPSGARQAAETLRDLGPFNVAFAVLLAKPPPTVSPEEADVRVQKYHAFQKYFVDQMDSEKELMMMSWIGVLRGVSKVYNVDQERVNVVDFVRERYHEYLVDTSRAFDQPLAVVWKELLERCIGTSDAYIMNEVGNFFTGIDEGIEKRFDLFYTAVILPSKQDFHDYAKVFLLEMVDALKCDQKSSSTKLVDGAESPNRRALEESLDVVEAAKQQVHLCCKNIVRIFQLSADFYTAKCSMVKQQAPVVIHMWNQFVEEMEKQGLSPLEARLVGAIHPDIIIRISRLDREVEVARTEFMNSILDILSERSEIIRILLLSLERLHLFGVCQHNVLVERTQAAISQAEKLMDTLADEALKIYSTGAVAGTFMLGSTLIDMMNKNNNEPIDSVMAAAITLAAAMEASEDSARSSLRASPSAQANGGTSTSSSLQKKKRRKRASKSAAIATVATADDDADLDEKSEPTPASPTVFALPKQQEAESPKLVKGTTDVGTSPLTPEQVACAAVIVNMRNVIAQYQNERRLLLTELRELRRSSKTAVQGSAPAKQDDNDLRRQVMELQSRNAVLQTQNDELMAMLEADKRKISKISSRISILEQELTK